MSGALGRAASRPRRPPGGRPDDRRVGQPPSRECPRLRSRRARRRGCRRRAGPRRRAPARRAARPVRLLFQPAEEVMPGGAAATIEWAPSTGVGRIFACTATRGSTPDRSGCGRGRSPGLRPDGGLPRGRRRSHLAAPPHRGPHRRPRQADHRGAGAAVAPGGPSGGLCVVWGRSASGRAQRDPGRGRGLRDRTVLDLAWPHADGSSASFIDEIAGPTAPSPRSPTSVGCRPSSMTRTSPELLSATP